MPSNPAIFSERATDARCIVRDCFEKTRVGVIEVLMKDLHTCGNAPRRMWEWVDMTMELAEEYA